jgi:modulator of FtsH protease HflC
MTRRERAIGLGAAAAGLFLAANALFTVDAEQTALVLRLGQPVRTANADGRAPGLYLKWPLVEQVVRLDHRTLALGSGSQEVAAAGGRRVPVRAEVFYRIVEPVQFWRATDGAETAPIRAAVDAGLQAALTGAPAAELQDDGRARQALDAARRSVARDGLGIRLESLSLSAAAPAEGDGGQLQARMAQQAAELRTEADAGKRQALADADREAADIRGEGERAALVLRGQGDAERAAVLGAAYGRDPAFARFFRRIEAYDQALNPKTTTLVLSGGGFLDLFANGPQGGGPPRR